MDIREEKNVIFFIIDKTVDVAYLRVEISQEEDRAFEGIPLKEVF